MRQDDVSRFWRQRDLMGGVLRMRTARFASLADRSLMAVRAEATAEDFAGDLAWEGCAEVGSIGDAALDSR